MLAALSCGACDAGQSAEPPEIQSIEVRGTLFEARDSRGKIWRSRDLVGSILKVRLGNSIAKIRIDALSSDVGGSSAVHLHKFSVASAKGGWRPLCRAAPDGQIGGFPLRGRWAATGKLEWSGGEDFEIVCAAGAQGKCVLLGYHPWEKLSNGSPAMSLFNACVRMMRADYSGRGFPTAKEGTEIKFFDKVGINSMPLGESFEFEAGWDERGAVCVHHPRVADNISLEQIEQSSTRLRGRTGRMCDQHSAESLGAVIFNGSRA